MEGVHHSPPGALAILLPPDTHALKRSLPHGQSHHAWGIHGILLTNRIPVMFQYHRTDNTAKPPTFPKTQLKYENVVIFR